MDDRDELTNGTASEVESTTRDDKCVEESKEHESMIPARDFVANQNGKSL
ncbi:MAG: hypothetical protein K2Y39_09145 [Candidatus Obscuribacterales bacterium]|nr:hypothetical protein [Candidatus Obscuribacterales bacterium]